MDEDSVTKIRQLNDHARCNFADCQIVLTRAVQKLENLDCLFTQIQQFDVFTQANDPYGEHDFGSCAHLLARPSFGRSTIMI